MNSTVRLDPCDHGDFFQLHRTNNAKPDLAHLPVRRNWFLACSKTLRTSAAPELLPVTRHASDRELLGEARRHVPGCTEFLEIRLDLAGDQSCQRCLAASWRSPQYHAPKR